MREDRLTQKFAKLTKPGRDAQNLPLGIGDDAALWKPKSGRQVILTCDWFLEGTHFLPGKHSPDSVGWKCLARALSDVAAMGGTPGCFLLSLALPASLTGRWLDQFLAGLRRAARHFACPLAGGDTTRRDQVLISIAIGGEIRSGQAVLRSGARPGDVLFVSGILGQAELGLRFLRQSGKPTRANQPCLKKHLYPEPRLALGRWLAEKRLASAMMDLSDGLSTDLPRLCQASAVGARVDAGTIPQFKLLSHRAPRIGSKMNSLDLALHGGEDYELLFTVPQRQAKRIPASFAGLPITRIGEITRNPAVILRETNGREKPLRNRGWDPFR